MICDMKVCMCAVLLNLTLFTSVFSQHALVQEQRSVPSFHAIYARDGIAVHLSQGTQETVWVEGAEQELPLLMTEVRENVLYVYYADDKSLHKKDRKGRVTITTAGLAGIKAGEGARVTSETVFEVASLELIAGGGSTVSMEIATQKLVVECTGGADMVLEGRADFFVAESSGGGHINGHLLKVSNAELDARGGSNIHIGRVGELTAEASGGANVSYLGKPEKVYVVKKGGGKVMRRSE